MQKVQSNFTREILFVWLYVIHKMPDSVKLGTYNGKGSFRLAVIHSVSSMGHCVSAEIGNIS